MLYNPNFNCTEFGTIKKLQHSSWVISSDKVSHPVAVRYCFKDYHHSI